MNASHVTDTVRLRSLSCRNFSGLRDGEYRFHRANEAAARSVAIVGKRSSGKTSLLAALRFAKELAGPYGRPPSLEGRARDVRRRVALDLELCITTKSGSIDQRVRFEEGGGDPLREVPPALASLLSRYDHGAPSFKVDYFPADRFLPSWSSPSKPPSALVERARRVSDDPTKYTSLWAWLTDALAKERLGRDAATQAAGFSFIDDASSLLRRLQANFSKLDPGIRIGGLRASGAPFFRDPKGHDLDVDALSGSARHALLFALAYEMVQHQRSVVLVDEPERGCLPDDAGARFNGLLELRRETQLIVATNSFAIAGCSDVVVEVGS